MIKIDKELSVPVVIGVLLGIIALFAWINPPYTKNWKYSDKYEKADELIIYSKIALKVNDNVLACSFSKTAIEYAIQTQDVVYVTQIKDFSTQACKS